MFKNILILLLLTLSLLLSVYSFFMHCNSFNVAEENETVEVNSGIDSVLAVENTIDSSFLFQDTISISDTVIDQPNRKQRAIVHTYHSNGMAALARVTFNGLENLIYYDSKGFVTALRWNEHYTKETLWLCSRGKTVEESKHNQVLFAKTEPERIYGFAAYASNFRLTKSPFACEY